MKAPTANVHVNLPDGDPGAPFTELAVAPEDLVQLLLGRGWAQGTRWDPMAVLGWDALGNTNAPPGKTRAMGRHQAVWGAHGPRHSERQT